MIEYQIIAFDSTGNERVRFLSVTRLSRGQARLPAFQGGGDREGLRQGRASGLTGVRVMVRDGARELGLHILSVAELQPN